MSFRLYLCFFLSGAAGLLYEIFWAQRFSLLLGLDVYSHAAVLTAFMGGLAIGSHLAGRRADALRRPWAAYAWLEVGIGLSGAAIPLVFPLLTTPMRAMYEATGQALGPMTLFRFAVSVVVLLLPTALMGATLPVMAVALRKSQIRLGEVVGRLYALNTIGAVAGILLGGFVLGEYVGLAGTNYCAVALNFAAALIAFTAGRSAPVELASHAATDSATSLFDSLALSPKDQAIVAPQAPAFTTLVALGAGLTGAAAMLTQLGWIRALSLSIGSSTYAFTLIVAVFLVGLAAGARISAWMLAKWRDAGVPWAYMCLATAALCLAVMYPLGQFPIFTGKLLNQIIRQLMWPVPLVYLTLGVLTLIVLIAPTIAIGTTFPLACEAYAQRRPRGVARVTGSVYAVNTIGAMLGSAIGGLICLGTIGMEGTLKLAACGYLAAGLLAAFIARAGTRPLLAAALASASIAAWFGLARPWQPLTMISAPHLLRRSSDELVLKFYREAPDGIIAIGYTPKEDDYSLFLNGKADASTRGDAATQVLLGQLPMLLHGNARETAVIGLGGGVTLASVLTHDPASVEMVELSQTVVEAIRPPDGGPGYFDVVNHRALDDPRVRLVVADGRNHLVLTNRKYDVIVSEPSNPWIAGISSLFTLEFFEACHERLNDDGILCQWLHSYTMQSGEFYRVISTISRVFEHTSVWQSPGGADFFLIATRHPRPALENIERAFLKPKVAADLEAIRIRSAAEIFGLHLVTAQDLRDLDLGPSIGKFADIAPNTDNFNRLRYAAARALWQPAEGTGYLAMSARRAIPYAWTGALSRESSSGAGLIARIEDVQDFGSLMLVLDATHDKSYRRAFLGGLISLDVDSYRKPELVQSAAAFAAIPIGPREHQIAANILQEAREHFEKIPSAANAEAAIRHARDARISAHIVLGLSPDDPDALAVLAEAQARMGRRSAARATLDRLRARGVAINDLLRRQVEASP